jgi:hypothetical protein
LILKLLDQLPTLYEHNLAPTAVFGSAVQAALTSLVSKMHIATINHLLKKVCMLEIHWW